MSSITLLVRVTKALLAEEERGLRLITWNTEFREDSSRASQATVSLPLSDDANTIRLVVELPRGSAWSAGATVWLGAQTFAPSSDGPLVGGRAGAGAVSFFTLRDELAQAKRPVPVKLMMTQPGLDTPRFEKLTVEIVDVVGEGDRERMMEWVAKRTRPNEFVPEFQDRHDDALVEYANTGLYPYSQEAARMGAGFAPSHEKIAPIHAPYWVANLPMPDFMFWMQTGITRYNTAMYDFMKTVRDISFARHGIDPQWFVQKINAQLGKDGDDYDDDVTRCVAVMMDMCAIAAVSTFYRYDEGFVLESQWFGTTHSSEKKSIESFQDALAYAGGDCEDVGSLIHRVFRWLQMGDPEHRDGSKYWRAYGGWTDPVLDAMQHMAYWYVSGGPLGSVTAARFTPSKGDEPQLLIRSDEDENLPIGGHIWQEALPVTKVEELMRRMNPRNVPEGTLRPNYGKAYPRWIKRLPHTVGEGTGAVYPLVLPLAMYAHSAEAKAKAAGEHAAMIAALTKIQQDTKVLRAMQIQRYSDRSKPVPDARVNYFYRRTTKFTTDDFFLQGIPRSALIWTLVGRRQVEKGSVVMGAPLRSDRAWDDEEDPRRYPKFLGTPADPKRVAAFLRAGRAWDEVSDAMRYPMQLGEWNADADAPYSSANDLFELVRQWATDVDPGTGIIHFKHEDAVANRVSMKVTSIGFRQGRREVTPCEDGLISVHGRGYLVEFRFQEDRNESSDNPRMKWWNQFATNFTSYQVALMEVMVNTDEPDDAIEHFIDRLMPQKTSVVRGAPMLRSAETMLWYWWNAEQIERIFEALVKHTGDEGVLSIVMRKDGKNADLSFEVLTDRPPPTAAGRPLTKHHPVGLVASLSSETDSAEEDIGAGLRNPYASFVGKKKSKKSKKGKKKSKKGKKKSKKSKKKDTDTDTDTDTGTDTEKEEEAMIEYFLTGAKRIGDIPGEPAPGELPTWGVNMRDKILTVNLAYEDGKKHNNVAFVVAPPVTNDQMALFKERMVHLPPWRQPWRTPEVERRLRAEFEPYIADFNERVRDIVEGGSDAGTQVNCIFRRNEFTKEKFRLQAVQDIAALSDRSRTGPHVQRVETAFEFIDDDIFNVRVSLWMQ